MDLWNIIRDFFVKYIFGGIASNGETFFRFAPTLSTEGEVYDNFNNACVYFGSNISDTYSTSLLMDIPNYLSTTATIIVLVLLCFLLVKLAIWIFKLGANLIRLR